MCIRTDGHSRERHSLEESSHFKYHSRKLHEETIKWYKKEMVEGEPLVSLPLRFLYGLKS